MAQLPLDQAIPRFKANEERADLFVNGDALTTWLTSTGVTMPSVAMLVEEFYTNFGARLYASIADARADTEHRDSLAIVYADPDPTNNGIWFWDESLDPDDWAKAPMQPLKQSDFDVLFKTVNNALAASAKPSVGAFEFYNDYPTPTYLSTTKYLQLDVDGRVFNSINNDGTSNIRGVTDIDTEGITLQFEFYNSPNLPQMGFALTDVDGRVFSGFDPNAIPLFENEDTGNSEQFALNLLTQVLIYVFYGQSLSMGSQGQPAISLTQLYPHLTFGSGPKSTKAGSLGGNPGTDTIKSLVEDNLSNTAGSGEGATQGETTCSGMANYTTVLLANNDGIRPSDCTIFSSTAGHGGYTIEQLNENSSWFQVWKDHVDEACARIRELDKTPIFPVISWIQGESNQGTSLSLYAAQLDSLRRAQVAYIKQRTGQAWEPPMHMYQTYASRSTDENGSASAQLWLARSLPSKYRLVTPVYFLPHAADGTHLNNIGYKWLGCYFARAFRDVLLNLEPVNFIMPAIPVKVDLSTIRISHKSGYPLQLMNKVTQHGYQVRVNDVVRGVTVSLDGNDVVLTLDTPMSSINNTVVVTYAREYKNPDLMPINGGCGDLCDTDPTTVTIEGVEYSLRSWCPSYRENARALSI